MLRLPVEYISYFACSADKSHKEVWWGVYGKMDLDFGPYNVHEVEVDYSMLPYSF